MPRSREFIEVRRLLEFPDGIIEVFGIGGPGVFTYEDGMVLSASDLSAEDEEPLRVEEIQSEEGTHFHVSGSSGFSVSLQGSESESRRVVSRWPHVVFRKTLNDVGIDVRIKEETPVQNLAQLCTPPQRSEIVFVPVGTSLATLTKQSRSSPNARAKRSLSFNCRADMS